MTINCETLSSKDTANKFNDAFTSVENTSFSISLDLEFMRQSIISFSSSSSFFLYTATRFDVSGTINKLKSNGSCGFD